MKGSYEESGSYEVLCSTCGETYDACQAHWCNCITDNPTLVCPHCGECFCEAGRIYQREFWGNAPRSLWARRLRNAYRVGNQPPLDVGNPIRRPLILVAEDDPNTLLVAYRVLEALGYGVLLAHDGLEALRLAESYKPDLIMTDHMMPFMNGKQLCKKIKEDPEMRNIPVIVITGMYRNKERARIEFLKDYGANDFINKPVPYERLGDILGAWLAPVTVN